MCILRSHLVIWGEGIEGEFNSFMLKLLKERSAAEDMIYLSNKLNLSFSVNILFPKLKRFI